MTAEPISQFEDTADPRSILHELPGREQENFLAIYREAVDGARDPEGWDYLRRVLRQMRGLPDDGFDTLVRVAGAGLR